MLTYIRTVINFIIDTIIPLYWACLLYGAHGREEKYGREKKSRDVLQYPLKCWLRFRHPQPATFSFGGALHSLLFAPILAKKDTNMIRMSDLSFPRKMSKAAPVHPKNFYGACNKGQTSFWAIYGQVGSSLLFWALGSKGTSNLLKQFWLTACRNSCYPYL